MQGAAGSARWFRPGARPGPAGSPPSRSARCPGDAEASFAPGDDLADHGAGDAAAGESAGAATGDRPCDHARPDAEPLDVRGGAVARAGRPQPRRLLGRGGRLGQLLRRREPLALATPERHRQQRGSPRSSSRCAATRSSSVASVARACSSAASRSSSRRRMSSTDGTGSHRAVMLASRKIDRASTALAATRAARRDPCARRGPCGRCGGAGRRRRGAGRCGARARCRAGRRALPWFSTQRITPELCAMLRKYHPLWLNTQFNHPGEVTPESSRAIAMLVDAGIPGWQPDRPPQGDQRLPLYH